MKDKRRYILALVVFSLVIVSVLLFTPRKPKKEVKPSRVLMGRIAIVLDDWGYSLNNMSIVTQIKYPLTIAVLPGLAHSKKISQDLHRLGFEIILHLPMEPKEKNAMEKDTIKTAMSEKQIRSIISKDLDAVSNVKGVSNHMGSMATLDIKTMGIVFRELKKRNLFFLDSYVTSGSKCKEAAAKSGLRFAKRDIFLDNSTDPRHIRQQLYKLRDKARVNGYAVGIGHDRKNTLQVLKDLMPEIEKEGYKFVFISEIAQ